MLQPYRGMTRLSEYVSPVGCFFCFVLLNFSQFLKYPFYVLRLRRAELLFREQTEARGLSARRRWCDAFPWPAPCHPLAFFTADSTERSPPPPSLERADTPSATITLPLLQTTTNSTRWSCTGFSNRK